MHNKIKLHPLLGFSNERLCGFFNSIQFVKETFLIILGVAIYILLSPAGNRGRGKAMAHLISVLRLMYRSTQELSGTQSLAVPLPMDEFYPL